jgi:lysozyme
VAQVLSGTEGRVSDFLTELAAELRADEGLRLKPYRDSLGILTIGVGHNLDEKGISYAAAMFILREDMQEAETLLDTNLPWWRTLTEDRQKVLINMAFNMGPKLLSFKNTLSLIETGKYADAADAMLESLWARQVGPRADRLAARMRGTP